MLDSVVGAEQPKMYYDPKGKIKDVLEKLPQLKKSIAQHLGLVILMFIFLYFDLIKKKQLSLNMIVLIS